MLSLLLHHIEGQRRSRYSVSHAPTSARFVPIAQSDLAPAQQNRHTSSSAEMKMCRMRAAWAGILHNLQTRARCERVERRSFLSIAS